MPDTMFFVRDHDVEDALASCAEMIDQCPDHGHRVLESAETLDLVSGILMQTAQLLPRVGQALKVEVAHVNDMSFPGQRIYPRGRRS